MTLGGLMKHLALNEDSLVRAMVLAGQGRGRAIWQQVDWDADPRLGMAHREG